MTCKNSAKWTLAVALAIAIVLSGLCVPLAFADETKPEVYAAVLEAQPGDTVSVPIAIRNNTGFSGMGLIISYDDDMMTPVAVDATGSITDGGFEDSIGGTVPGLASNAIKVLYSGNENKTDDGLLFYVVFETSTQAQGSIAVKVDYEPEDTFDEEIEEIELSCKNGAVVFPSKTEKTTMTPSIATHTTTTKTQDVDPTETGVSILRGDANDDGAVNMKDVLTLRKYLASMDVSINLENADANADDAVNMKDVLALRKMLAS